MVHGYGFTANTPLNFEMGMSHMAQEFVELGYATRQVDTGHWQSLKDVPHTKTREIQNAFIAVEIPPTKAELMNLLKPNLPWAEDHFQERVSGEPLNPGEEYKNWPWYRGGVEDHKETGQFSHTYMERYWPKQAGNGVGPSGPFIEHVGIRYKYGDLNDVVALLAREPYTRQAYLPIWFPEDINAAANESERVPCSLGYHFMLREGALHCFYPMRSVDFVRYLRDDLYLTGRLVQWVLDQLRSQAHDGITRKGEFWDKVNPGTLTLFASSCHIFEGDVGKVRRDYGLAS